MAGTIVASTLSDGTNSTSTTNCITGSAKAWIAFNSNTQTTYGSFNVTSITYLSTTRYQINFTTAMANVNYAVALAASDSPTVATFLVVDNSQLPTTTALTLYSNANNRLYYSAAVFSS